MSTEGHWRAHLHTLLTTRWQTCRYQYWSHTQALCGHTERELKSFNIFHADSKREQTYRTTLKLSLFHMHPTAEGYQLVPTDLPHRLTQGLLFLFFLSSRYCKVWIKYTTFLLTVFLREYILAWHQYTVSSIKADKWRLRNLVSY